MKKVALLGHFAFGTNSLDGQTVKTKVLLEMLSKRFGEESILTVDTWGWKQHPFQFALKVWLCVKQAKNIVMLPAQNGLRLMTPLLYFSQKFYRSGTLHYVVIGGWLSEFLQKRRILKYQLRKFAGIYVETQIMKNALEAQGFSNIHIMPNCKKLPVLSAEDCIYPFAEPHRLCTFSRVMREKGIEDAVEAVEHVNKKLGRRAYKLDIYGQVDSNQTDWFANLQKHFSEDICYKGIVPYEESVGILKNYFALLFPTRFYTEGIPGTIIDAYAAGVPVICSKWESFEDVVDEANTGYGYMFGDKNGLFDILNTIADKPERVTDLKRNCLEKYARYSPESVLEILVKNMEE